MVWFTRFFFLLPLISVFFVFANDHQYAKIPEKKTIDVKTEVVNKSEPRSEPGVVVINKVLVEVTDAIEEEEEALVYTPSIAPATPQLLTSSQYLQYADAEISRNKPVDDEIKTEGVTVSKSKLKPEFGEVVVANKVLVEVIDAIEEEEEERLVYTSSIATPSSLKSHLADTTVSTSMSTVSKSVQTDYGSSIHKNGSPKVEDKSGSDLEKENEKLLFHINANKQSKHDESSVEMVSNDASQQQLSSAEKEQYDEESDKVKGNIAINGVSLKDMHTHSDTPKQKINEKKSVARIDSVNLTKEGNKDNKPVLHRHQELPQQQSKHKGVVTSKDENDSNSKNSQLNIAPEISPLNHNTILNDTTVDKEIKKELAETISTKSLKLEGESSAQDENALETKVVDPKQQEQQHQQQHQKQSSVITSSEKLPVEVGESINTKDEKKMLSFAEWKKRLDKEKVEEYIIVDSKLPVPKNKTILKKTNKIKKNFASIDCGGKVVSANEEASNILSLLKEDKDVYMLNPCNVKAWFVVELCDRIQIDSIDLANFEMFSSTPQIFNVYVTSRYPSGSWEKVGTFHAKPEKQIQTFVFEEKFYARYIKIEIKKYFGNEHYCPLSLLRVFGITEVEQFEDNDEQDNSPEELNPDDIDHMTEEHNSDANAGNIFEAAKNVVADLVNGMAKKLSGKSNIEMNHSGISEQGGIRSSVVVMVTELSTEPVIGEANSTYYKDSIMVGTTSVDWEMWYYYRYPKRTCSNADLKSLIKKIKATVYFIQNSSYNSNLHQILPSMLADNNINITPSQKIAMTPHLPSISKSISESNINVSVVKSEVTPCEVQKATSKNVEKANIPESSTATSLLDVNPVEKPTVKLNEEGTTAVAIETGILSNATLLNDSAPTQSSVTKPVYNEESVDILEFKINETLKGAVIAEKIIPNNISNADDVPTNVTANNLTAVPQEKVVDGENISDINLDNDSHIENQDQVIKTKDNGSETSIEVINPSTSVLDISQSSIETEKLTTDIENNTSTVEITSNSQVKSNDKKKDNVPEHSIEKDTQTSAAKTASGSKESIIAKLNAKVKGLQANLTMSMMYLDEMSERYRTAVEEVDERHKKKHLALNASIEHHEFVIKHQTNLIANLTKQVNEIAFQIKNLTQTTQEQHQKIIETHATWVFLEIIIILIFLLLCRSNPKSYNEDRDNELARHRRFSEPVVLKDTEIRAMERPLVKKQLSDPTGFSDSSCYNNSQLQSVALAKKRKRKKNSKTNVSDIEINKAGIQSISGTTEKAGLISGRGLINGIAGAFNRRRDSTEKLSRQADALLDEVSDTTCLDIIPLRKVKSSELPTIDEDKTDEFTIIERPKSCSYLHDEGGCNKYKKNHRAAGRFG